MEPLCRQSPAAAKMSLPSTRVRSALLTLCCSLQTVRGDMHTSPPPPPFGCVFVGGDGQGGPERLVGLYDTPSACAQAAHSQYPTANGATYATTGNARCYAEFGMSGHDASSRWVSCLFPNVTALDCDFDTPCFYRLSHVGNTCGIDPSICGQMALRCCAENCYCGPILGVYLAPILLVLLGPCVLRRLAGRQAGRQAPRIPLLTAMAQLGFILVLIAVIPQLEHGADLRVYGIRSPWRTKRHQFIAFLPLGLMLVLLSLLPSLGDTRAVVAIAFLFMGYALAVIVASSMTVVYHLEQSANEAFDAIHPNSRSAILIYLAVAVANLILFLATLPIVCRGSLLRPTRQRAAWRLRHLWWVWRTGMAIVSLWYLVIIIIRAVAPETPGLNGDNMDEHDRNMELLYLISMVVQGALFSLLGHNRRTRLSFLAVRLSMRRRWPRHLSSQEYGPRVAVRSSIVEILQHASLISTHSSASRHDAVDTHAASLAVWLEDPPGLGARLVVHGMSNRRAEGTTLFTSSTTTEAADPVTELGQGGYAIVLRAQLGSRPVAAKVAKPTSRREDTAQKIEAFQREVQVMMRAGFRHDHLLECVGTCVFAGCPTIVLEYYEGGDLSQALGLHKSRTGSAWPKPELAAFTERWRLAPQLASGLAHLHAQGVLHCDIKASNVLLRPNGRHALGHAVLSDFGLSTVASATTEQLCGGGTVRYMAPEASGCQ